MRGEREQGRQGRETQPGYDVRQSLSPSLTLPWALLVPLQVARWSLKKLVEAHRNCYELSTLATSQCCLRRREVCGTHLTAAS